MAGYVLVRVFGVVLLIAVNAFFVATEFALVSVRDTRIQQMIDAGRLGARNVLRLHERLDDLLAAVQLGVTLASLGLGWIGESTLASIFERAFEGLPHSQIYAHTLGSVISFLLITYFLVVLGELVPKSLSLHRGERVALGVAGPMLVFMAVSRPFLRVMSTSARWVLRRFGTSEVRPAGVHSPEELKLMVRSSQQHGMVPAVEEQIMLRALEMGELTVRQIMVPRPRIFSLPSDMPLEQALARVVEEQHSRIPVYDAQRGPEYIVGLLYSKDLTRWMRVRYTKGTADEAGVRLARMSVRDIMRDAMVVPESKSVTDLLAELRRRKRHLAVVVDEFGSTSGVVTVEDALEQLVGEIEDEFDVAAQPMPAGATTMVLDGATPLRDLETQYRIELPSDRGFETLAGFLLYQFQRIPASGEAVDFGGHHFTVLEMEGRRIGKVLVETKKASSI